ncbi:MAG: LTA synthase family protein, partial [Bacteroidota bacterium]
MKSILIFPLRILISYYAIFNIFRLIFLAAAFYRQPELDLLNALGSFSHGISLDLSASSYFAAIPALLWSASLFWKKDALLGIATAIHSVLTALCIVILCGNLAIYGAWGTMLDYRALSFVTEPKGIIASLSNIQLIAIAILLPLLVISLVKLSKTFVSRHAACPKAYRFAAPLLILFGLFFLMRGGLQTVPINNSRAWYCNVQVLNDAAANPAWYLFDNINRNLFQSTERFNFMDAKVAERLFSELTDPSSVAGPIAFKLPEPNIVLVVLESWSADLSAQLTGGEGAVLMFDSLCTTGLLFDSVYASGRRTDHMFPSILCGIPSVPERSLVRYN